MRIKENLNQLDIWKPPPPSELYLICKNQNNIFQTYKDDTWYKKYNNTVLKSIKNAATANYFIFTEKDREIWINHFFPPHTDINKAYYAIHPLLYAARSDLWRWLVIFIHGGLYLDIKSSLIKPINFNLLKNKLYVSSFNNTKCSPYNITELSNWFIFSNSKNIAVKYIIDIITSNILNKIKIPKKNNIFDHETSIKWETLHRTGPRASTIALYKAPDEIKKHVIKVFNGGKNLGLEGTVKYGDFSHINIENNLHYSKLNIHFYSSTFNNVRK